ncbi:vitamin K epoxide reductase [Corynebacterium poyangense]|uniref:Vitamin K epoxide reductase n=1 Tax=Corynebacterium poyangense TaxID=2684405 RepID=A0A7H0SQT8_9CORY|nr:vitamin K epoxide reductase family protein [Corynebacterium poyangense]MBZ8178204.1 vitamin K epoxide reductase [Corynebacterium poyangense]QNQ90913.1 vitamin K epoxide reductase [Corynebacterium poyangense]
MTRESGAPAGTYRSTRAYAWGIVFFSAVALLFSSLLIYERIFTLEDPTHIPACTINSFISCTDVMNTPQAKVIFGIPNTIFGVIGYSVFLTLGVIMLAGFHPPKWIWYGMLAGTLIAALGSHWLFYQSIFVIVALCPYCGAVWASSMGMFISTVVTLYRRRREAAGLAVSRDIWLPTVIWVVWVLAIAFLIGDRLFF